MYQKENADDTKNRTENHKKILKKVKIEKSNSSLL